MNSNQCIVQTEKNTIISTQNLIAKCLTCLLNSPKNDRKLVPNDWGNALFPMEQHPSLPQVYDYNYHLGLLTIHVYELGYAIAGQITSMHFITTNI
jgi:hypothetical protein